MTPPKPPNYWKNWNNVEKELRSLIEKIGHFPTRTELRSIDSSLVFALEKYHGGFPAARQRMGFATLAVEQTEQLERILEEYLKA